MVGYYVTPFVYRPGSFEVIGGTISDLNVPGASWTKASGINSLGLVVGTYEDSNGNDHGFLRNGSTYTPFDGPAGGGGVNTVGGINDKGNIVGTYFGLQGNLGFLLSGGTYTTISFPDSISTCARGINQSGQIVGDYEQPGGGDNGFLYSDGTYTTLDVPGAYSKISTASTPRARL
jgi:probable HAF family extracellular repeat protein